MAPIGGKKNNVGGDPQADICTFFTFRTRKEPPPQTEHSVFTILPSQHKVRGEKWEKRARKNGHQPATGAKEKKKGQNDKSEERRVRLQDLRRFKKHQKGGGGYVYQRRTERTRMGPTRVCVGVCLWRTLSCNRESERGSEESGDGKRGMRGRELEKKKGGGERDERRRPKITFSFWHRRVSSQVPPPLETSDPPPPPLLPPLSLSPFIPVFRLRGTTLFPTPRHTSPTFLLRWQSFKDANPPLPPFGCFPSRPHPPPPPPPFNPQPSIPPSDRIHLDFTHSRFSLPPPLSLSLSLSLSPPAPIRSYDLFFFAFLSSMWVSFFLSLFPTFFPAFVLHDYSP